MAWTEKPPMLTGDPKADTAKLRDYLFRMAGSLDEVAGGTGGGALSVVRDATGRPGSGGSGSSTDIDKIRKNAQELRDLIIKSAHDLQSEIDENGDDLRTQISNIYDYEEQKEEEYRSLFVAQSEYGTFTEAVDRRITETATNSVDKITYNSAVESMQDSIGLLQNYYTSISGEIIRGIVEDPETHDYVTGIAIAQSLRFAGECKPGDTDHPDDDAYTYYYLEPRQTFGLYTSVGWQFWIDGYKYGWYSSLDGMLHVSGIATTTVRIGDHWQLKSVGDGSELELLYV